MECAEISALLEEYQTGRLEAPLRGQVAAHLERCRACVAGAGDLAEARRALRALPPASAPAGIWERVRDRIADRYAALPTPLGAVYLAYSAAGISHVGRGADAPAFEREHARRYRRALSADPAPPPWVARALEQCWSGERMADLKLDLRLLSPFQQAVLAKTRQIPRGEVRPYAWVAKEVGQPKAVRAVGSALARNPVPLLIPCHRVVRGEGTVGEYAWGAAAKRQLLQLEGVDPDALAAGVKAGARFHGSRTTKIFCFPTCHQARRIQGQHRVTFASAAAAQDAGYRPCRLCRPAS